jgi:general secretion pathway protein C
MHEGDATFARAGAAEVSWRVAALGPEGVGVGRLNHNGRMTARLFAFVIWAAVAASVTFWGLRLLVISPRTPGHAVAVADGVAASADVTRLLGSAPKQLVSQTPVSSPEVGARFRLAGVMAPKPKAQSTSAQGVALISVDGKPARAFGVGARIDGDLMLQAVSLRSASIGSAQGAAAVVLELPPLPPAATGSLPPLVSGMTELPLVRPSPLPPRPQSQPVPPLGAPAKQPVPDTVSPQSQVQ